MTRSNNNELEEELLEQHENCPGCKVDRQKQAHTGLPIKQFIIIWVVVLCVALPISSLFPFLYFMVRDFNIADKEEDISYYAGFVGSAYMVGRALTSVFWGVVADRYGRKPVILLGTTTVVIFNTLFGFSVSYWMAILTRFFLGFLNGLLGPIKAYACELFREENQALGLSAISTSWGIGLIIGPALGGYLAQPAEKFPGLVSPDSLFGRFPYLLPCLCISVFALFVTIGAIWLPETLHFHKKSELESDSFVPDAVDKTDGKNDSIMIRLLKNWPLMSSVIVYCVFSLHDMAYTEEQHERGAANGISITLQSISKAIGPACGGALLSWSQKRQNAAFLPGDQMIFFILNVIEGIGVLLTFKPFLISNHY